MFLFRKSKNDRLHDALEKLKLNDTQVALAELHALAEEGCAEAAQQLGEINEFALEDLSAAAAWYRQAAELGHAKAQWCIANLLSFGRGTTVNHPEALRWYHAAAANGVSEAQFSLAEFYRAGMHVEQDTSTALYWYERSAKQGCKSAAIRIQQFWPNGRFQERQQCAPTTPHPPTTGDVTVNRKALSPLAEELLTLARQRAYIPDAGLTFVPELQRYQQELLDFVCSAINQEMKTTGLTHEQMIAVFRYVFFRGVDLTYQWHKSPDGRIDNTMNLSNPLQPDLFLQIPPEVRSNLEQCAAPAELYAIMGSWWNNNAPTLRQMGIDIWQPLWAALTITCSIGVSIAVKSYGYCNDTSGTSTDS